VATTLLLFAALCGAPPAHAADTIEIAVTDRTPIPIERYPANGKVLLLWLPSEYGLPNLNGIGAALARRGVETWSADLLGAYFLPTTPSGLDQIPNPAVADLIERARAATGKRVVLFANDRGAALALRGARAWQQRHPGRDDLAGAVLVSPTLFVETPEAGRDANFLPIASATNLSLYVIQPALAPGYWRLRELQEQLSRGGSSVYLRTLPDVRDRFWFRPDPLPAEPQMTERLPALLQHAVIAVARDRRARAAAQAELPVTTFAPKTERQLRPYAGDPQPWPLTLPDLAGKQHQLADYRGRVVLINFWASWCPPCVKEMPSLQELQRRLRDRPFTLLAVNMAEAANLVREFLKTHDLDFTVLLDADGTALKQWKVMAFPTSFVLDKQGRIRYALFGSIEWMEPDALNKLDELLAEP
jgi:peroxiredoxin